MDIKNILDSLGLDFSNPEVKRGALEAIEAIITSRVPMNVGNIGSGGGSNDVTEVELDPDLLQPSIKQAPSGINQDDIEIEDEEDILGQIKHNDSEEPKPDTNTAGDSSNRQSDTQSTETEEPGDSAEDSSEEVSDDMDSTEETGTKVNNDSTEESSEEDGFEDNDVPSDDAEVSELDAAEPAVEDSDEDVPEDTDELGQPGQVSDEINSEETEDEEDEFEDEFDFDEDDLLDNELRSSTEDEEVKAKHEARKIKRERTLAAARKALAGAHTKKVSPALIRELEKAIEALEALTEAVTKTKSIKDISDAEFNLLVNRVFDAIQACGDSDLSFTSEEERSAQVKNIKDDIASTQTQMELSAEDIAKIRAETQAVKARDKETTKYASRARGSFKGFQEFLSSLYKAIALQVQSEETRDDSWSAISHRNSGAGVLQQGKRINELPNKKIPVIDFYFDQSTSWTSNDLKVGMKAVQQLADMDEKGQIKLNIFYFADEVSSTPIRGGTSGWNEIVKNVIATQATNVVVMTDRDMETWWNPQNKPPLSYTVPGYVWYLWKNGENAQRLPRDLKGRGGTQQFSFNINDAD